MSITAHTRRARLWALAGIVPLVLTACGSSGGDSSSAPDSPSPAAPGASSSGAADSGPALSVGLLMSVKGEDAYSIDDYYQGAQLALEQINAAGGFHGQPVKSFRVAAPSDPTALTTSLLKVAGKKPSVIVGAPPPQLAAISRQIDQSAIPIIGTSSYPISDGHAAGSKWVLMTLANDPDTVNAAAKYAVSLGKKVAVLHTNEAFGQAGSEALKKDIPAAGGSIVTDQAFAPDATDLTGALLASKDADVVVSWAYPAPQAVGINAIANQGKSTPTVGNAGISSSVTNKIITKKALTQIFSTVPCNTQDPRPATKKFFEAFKAKYGSQPSYISAQAYDSVYLALAAAKTAKSLGNDDMLAALQGLDYTDGACAGAYQADSEGVLVHSVTIQGFTADSNAVTKKVYDFPPAA